MDEATSSVEPENEHLLVEALEELGKNKTVISIAHRLQTVRKADRIYVISNGSVDQEGRHMELMKVDGICRRFTETRTKSLEWGIIIQICRFDPGLLHLTHTSICFDIPDMPELTHGCDADRID